MLLVANIWTAQKGNMLNLDFYLSTKELCWDQILIIVIIIELFTVEEGLTLPGET